MSSVQSAESCTSPPPHPLNCRHGAGSDLYIEALNTEYVSLEPCFLCLEFKLVYLCWFDRAFRGYRTNLYSSFDMRTHACTFCVCVRVYVQHGGSACGSRCGMFKLIRVRVSDCSASRVYGGGKRECIFVENLSHVNIFPVSHPD